MGDWHAEHWVLTTPEGTDLLASVAQVVTPEPADLARWRRTAPFDAVSAALRIAQTRRRAAAKFARAEQMWLEPTGLEQATAEPVARHKATRFEGLVADLCCGIGGDAVALAERTAVLAVDTDEGMCRRTAWNAHVYGVADRVEVIRARAEQFTWPATAFVHIDPDRRAHGDKRAQSVAQYAPGLESIRRMARKARGGAIKLGPASDFAAHFGSDDLEIELTSLAGECKEATVWFGDRATCGRRATVLPDGATWTDRDGPPNAHALTVGIAAWLFEPDPALIRAGLVDGFAVAHGLGRCAAGVDYLTGPEAIVSPFLAAFEVIAVLPFDLKRLKHETKARQLGPLEIKARGLDVRPDELRRALSPPGPNGATLILIGGRGPARAVLARRPSLSAPAAGQSMPVNDQLHGTL
jgi:SAM-dependent methyltransferase